VYLLITVLFLTLLSVPSFFLADVFNSYFSFLSSWSSGILRADSIRAMERVSHLPRYKPKTRPEIKLVDFRLRAPKAGSVRLSADFNRWNPQFAALEKDPDGSWQLSVPLPPGKYLYLFEEDGRLIPDPRNPLKEISKDREVSVLEVR